MHNTTSDVVAEAREDLHAECCRIIARYALGRRDIERAALLAARTTARRELEKHTAPGIAATGADLMRYWPRAWNCRALIDLRNELTRIGEHKRMRAMLTSIPDDAARH